MAAKVTTKNLYDAAKNGDVATLEDLMQQEPNLAGEVLYARSRNVLHIAAMHGQGGIVEVLSSHRQLARDVDSQNSTPLHIAAAQGSLHVALKLISMAPETCLWRDCHNMNPLHIAAVNGHINILQKLLETNSSPVVERVHRGETVLHLCIKYNRLVSLKFLVEKFRELVCAKDDDGETVLHLAVRFNQLQTIRYLVKQPYIEKKAHNSLGKTALQILNEIPHTPRYSDMEKLLKIRSTQKISNVFPNLTDTTMVVVVLIATMAFQAAVSPPGGVWQEHTASHKAGDAVMASTHPKLYKQFVRANTIAFGSAIITIFLITTRQPSGRIVFLLISLFTMWLSLASIALSYGASIMVISPNMETQSLVPVIIVVVVVSLGIIGFIYVYSIIREWFLRRDTALPRSHTSSDRVINNVGRVLRSSGPKT
ncbi:ankyrin repeat-containing protein At2g01680-like [Salvia hispanica]|uniref:ankyrin repeat-containing protein At2g01680-like n=1 Tax=Salvia hispanica TaxID=49212 RepID=UPI00200930D2|nr:ankyrin repeat-containing protein At2g01680-like [Salvia hispanica]